MSLLTTACHDEIENIDIQAYQPKSDEYYANLRAYKNSKHQRCVGWFEGWKAVGASKENYLMSLPDSVDFVMIGWRQWANLTQRQIDDMNTVRDLKGTKVLLSVLIQNLGQEFTPDEFIGQEKQYWGWDDQDPASIEAAIRKFANAICDSVYKYNYDGFDLDYEPNYGGSGNLAGVPSRMRILVDELSKRVGPSSGTGKMMVLDGETLELEICEECTPHFDFFISQAYNTSHPQGLQNRFNEVEAAGFTPEQWICVENFQVGLWVTGGCDYRDPVHGTIPSLIGMAYFHPIQGVKGGCGSFSMQNEYKHDYKFLRQAIQIMNPAKPE